MGSLSTPAGSRPNGRRSGQAMVEFALVAPLFFLLLFFIVEGGRFVFFYEMLNNATRDGARYAIVHGSNSVCPSGPNPPNLPVNTCDPLGNNVKAAVRTSGANLASDGDLFIKDPVWTPNNARESLVTVYVDYRYNPVIPLLPPITISAESTLVINN